LSANLPEGSKSPIPFTNYTNDSKEHLVILDDIAINALSGALQSQNFGKLFEINQKEQAITGVIVADSTNSSASLKKSFSGEYPLASTLPYMVLGLSTSKNDQPLHNASASTTNLNMTTDSDTSSNKPT
jgi:hypothetical protein